VIRFGYPWSLLALLVFPFAVWCLRHAPRGAALQRGGAWLCLCFALAGPELLWGRGRESLVLAVDLSASTSRSLRQGVARLRDVAGESSGLAPIGIVAVAEKAHLVISQGTERTPVRITERLDQLATQPEKYIQPAERDATNIAAGLDLAGLVLPRNEGGRVILATDGWETRGDARRAARDLAQRGIVIDTLIIGGPEPGSIDAAVASVEAPAQVPQGVPFEVRGVLRSVSGGPAGVSLLRDGAPVTRQETRISRGDTAIRFPVVAETRGMHRYGIRVSVPRDEEPRNDSAETAVSVLGRPQILWVARAGDTPPPRTGLQVIHARPQALGEYVTRLMDFDAVVLSNVEVEALAPGFLEALREHVGSFGGGFLMTGGLRSFGPGGYRATPVEEMLPVNLDPGSRGKRPGLGLVLALDKSGSMADLLGTSPKIGAAREAAVATAALLEPGDRFGLLAFDDTARPIFGLREAPGSSQLRAILDRLTPRGGTRILPALSGAAAMLRPLKSWRRHIVLVTDGRGEGGDFAAPARALAAAGTTVSAIAVGDDADVPLLRALASAGGGRFEVARDADRLSAILRREVVLARGPVVHEAPTAIRCSPHPVVGRVCDQRVPPVSGYVSTAPKPFAALPLRTEDGEPILALGGFGLGRTGALTTDLRGPWGAEWRSWAGRDRLLTQLLAWLVRAPLAGQVTIVEEPAREGWTLTVRAEDHDGNHLNGRALAARLRADSGTAPVMPLEQRGPGTYSGALPVRVARPTAVTVEDRSDGRGRIVGAGWIGLSYPEEYRVRGPNQQLLEAIVRETGGRSVDGGGVAPAIAATRRQAIPLWPWLTWAALGLFVLDLVGVPRFPRRLGLHARADVTTAPPPIA
jgi:uncharacterized membrane protein/NAD(P)H-hydrate repair Nnr-like enzyme with NAD(P)H-hydrate epimerase domain